MLEVVGICKRFGGLQAVSGLTFTAAVGKVTSLIGPNGAGKSTAFNLISGTLRPDQGRVRLSGADVTSMAPHKLARMGLARSFQITNLMFGLSVYENVRLAAQSRIGAGRWFARTDSLKEPASEARATLREFDLGHLAELPAGSLSHGDQRRLEVAVCMSSRPSLLLLDEPTQGMSPAETGATEKLIRRLADKGVAILLVEHDIDLVMRASDHVVVMNQGQKIAEGTPSVVRADLAVQQAYLGTGSESETLHA